MKLSIVVSTYNRATDFLPKCLDSILSQDFSDFELIVVDDCSTDTTREVIKEYSSDERLRYKRLHTNFGSDTKPKNTGALLARSEYLMFVDDDVQLRKHALSTLIEAIEKENRDVVYGDMWVKPLEEPGIAHDFDRQFLMLRNFIDTSSALMKTKAFMAVGGFDETLPKFVDWNLWVRMAKAGFNFKRVSQYTFDYYLHEDTKSNRVKTETYIHPKLGELFTPTFGPTGCYIHSGAIGKEKEPQVAIFTLTHDRLDYTKQTYAEMKASAGYPFRWFVSDNGSSDGTKEWLLDTPRATFILNKTNIGISRASNLVICEILRRKYDIVIKIDNDVEFLTRNWLADIVDLWKRNRKLYVSPYVEGLVNNPGGAPRVGYGLIGDDFVEVTKHIGGIFAAIDASAYQSFKWTDTMLHGNQDMEASQAFIDQGYMPCYLPKHRIAHRDSTAGQWEKYPEYFERRQHEKITTA